MNLVTKYISRYFIGWRQLNILWKAGVIVTVLGMAALLVGVWLTPSDAINSPAAVQQRNIAVALIAGGLLLRFAGALVHARRSLMQRRR